MVFLVAKICAILFLGGMSMIKVCFVCLGNICRSPMAEFVFLDMVKKQGLQDLIEVASRGTSDEELGNPMHPGTVLELRKHQIPYHDRTAKPLEEDDYQKFDYLISVDAYNLSFMQRFFLDKDSKIYRLLDFTPLKKDIADPWYTGNFSLTYQEVSFGCECFLDYLKEKENLN